MAARCLILPAVLQFLRCWFNEPFGKAVKEDWVDALGFPFFVLDVACYDEKGTTFWTARMNPMQAAFAISH